MREGFAKLPTKAAILDGELCLIDFRSSAHFWRLMTQMRTRRPEESELMFLAFHILHQDVRNEIMHRASENRTKRNAVFRRCETRSFGSRLKQADVS
jgi:ATP-dependent DNA ligase